MREWIPIGQQWKELHWYSHLQILLPLFDCDSCVILVTDIDECNFYNGGCHEICVNAPGTFYCVCRKGYWLNSIRKICMGKTSRLCDSYTVTLVFMPSTHSFQISMNATLEMVVVTKSVKTRQAIMSVTAIVDTSWPVMEGAALMVNSTTDLFPSD